MVAQLSLVCSFLCVDDDGGADARQAVVAHHRAVAPVTESELVVVGECGGVVDGGGEVRGKGTPGSPLLLLLRCR